MHALQRLRSERTQSRQNAPRVVDAYRGRPPLSWSSIRPLGRACCLYWTLVSINSCSSCKATAEVCGCLEWHQCGLNASCKTLNKCASISIGGILNIGIIWTFLSRMACFRVLCSFVWIIINVEHVSTCMYARTYVYVCVAELHRSMHQCLNPYMYAALRRTLGISQVPMKIPIYGVYGIN